MNDESVPLAHRHSDIVPGPGRCFAATLVTFTRTVDLELPQSLGLLACTRRRSAAGHARARDPSREARQPGRLPFKHEDLDRFLEARRETAR